MHIDYGSYYGYPWFSYLLLLTSLPASYEHFVYNLLYRREALTLEDVMTTLYSKEIKERSKTKGNDGEGLYVRGRIDHRDSCQSRGKSRSKSRGGRLNICQSEDHLKRNYPKNNRKKSTCYVKKDDKPRSSGSTYDDSEVMMLMSAEALLDWIIDSGCSYHITPKLDIFFDFLNAIRVVYYWVTTGSVRSKVLARNLISLGTLEKVGYTVKLKSGKVKSCAGLAQKTGTYQRGETIGAGKARAVWQENPRHTTQGVIDYVHSDLWGLSQVESLGVENQTRRTIKNLRTDNGLEFCNWEFEQLCIESGTARHLTVFGMPQQNGLAERMNITLMDKVEVELQRLNNHMLEEDQTDQEDGDDEDVGDQKTNQTPDLKDYQLAQDREPRTRTKPLRFRDESNMAAYMFVAAEEEDTHEPLTYQEAVACEDSSNCKWLFNIKEGTEGVQKPRCKARLVARRFIQRADYELEQIDVKTAFLHGNLEEVIYMRQPLGYEQGNKVCLLNKSLYGLKRSPRQWYRRFDEYMLSNGFKHSSYDSCVYYRSYAPGVRHEGAWGSKEDTWYGDRQRSKSQDSEGVTIWGIKLGRLDHGLTEF
ncbi:retrotransposon protein, putative, ty1-copia subclass [Tanacetum coccineum]